MDLGFKPSSIMPTASAQEPYARPVLLRVVDASDRNMGPPSGFSQVTEHSTTDAIQLIETPACRLCQMDCAAGEAVLARVIAENFLRQTADGASIAFPAPSRTFKATFPPAAMAHHIA